MPFSIRSRLLLLLLSVLLPGMLGVAWLIANTFQSERAANERNLSQVSFALAAAVHNQISQRAMVARLLAGSHWLDAPTTDANLAQFRQQARSAMDEMDGWVELRSPQGLLVDTRPTGQATAIASPISEARALLPFGSSAGANHASLIEPVRSEGRVRYEIAVTLPTAGLQRLLDAQPVVPGSTVSIVDATGHVLAQRNGNHGPVGEQVSAAQLAAFEARSEGAFQAVDDDGEGITGFFISGPPALRFVSAMPSAALFAPWPSAVLRIALAAGSVLLLAVAGGLWLSSRITRPLGELKDAARRLLRGESVTFESTGIAEFDEVATTLVQAGAAIVDARRQLETQVDAAVARTRTAEQLTARSQRVEALGRLTGGVAHDFNNLLGIISNSMHLVQRHPGAAADLQLPIGAALRAVEVGSQLTQHLLRFAGRRPTDAQRVYPAHALPEMQELIRSVLGGRITIAVQTAAGTRPVTLDPGELELAVINLALNARDAMPAGGKVQLRARNALPGETQDLAATAAGYVLITVSDDGVGIEQQTLARVFEPFFTTKGVGKGTGLGLSQVLGFCLQVGGTARIDSTLGIGTTVSLLLPAAASQADAAAEASASVANQAATNAVAATATSAADLLAEPVAGARILLVEDNDSLAAMTAALLRANGATVHHAGDAGAALRALEHEGHFDAVLSDVVMPGALDGLDLARRLRQQRPTLPIVLISGYNDAAAQAATEFVLLHKPCPPAQLLAALHSAIWPPAVRSLPLPLQLPTR